MAPTDSKSGLVPVRDRSELSPLLVPRPFRVIDRIQELDDTFSLHVVPVEGELPAFRPAQVSMLGAFGVGEAAISISSPLSTRSHHAYTIRRAGPITRALTEVPIGGVVTVRGPFGEGWPLDTIATKNLVIIGGGLGIAPLRALIDLAIEERSRFDDLALVYGAKRPDLILYQGDLDRWSELGLDVRLTVDQGDDAWAGSVGLVTDLLGTPAGLGVDWTDTTVFICGPDVMMHFTALALHELGVPENRLWLTLERNMQCGNALCGHCQLGPFLICRDGPVVNYADVGRFHRVREL